MLVSWVDVGDGKVGLFLLKMFTVNSSTLLVQLIYKWLPAIARADDELRSSLLPVLFHISVVEYSFV